MKGLSISLIPFFILLKNYKMRFFTIIGVSLLLVTGCSRSSAPDNSKSIVDNPDSAYANDYKPNPDEVVISARLISFSDNIAKVEVIKQLATGFGAKMVISPGDELSLSTSSKPSDNFICAFEVADVPGDDKTYRITRFLK